MMSTSITSSNRPGLFFLLVFILSAPFWLIGVVAEPWMQIEIPINLPISALMFVCPAIAALFLVNRNRGLEGIKRLLKESLNARITSNIWYVPVFLLEPIIMVMAYGLMKIVGGSIPDLQVNPSEILALFLVFVIAAICEEIGWQGYAYDALEKRWNALVASMVIGVVWQVWHIVPHLQLHPPEWILWQCAGSVLLRILIVWLYKNTGKSVLAAALFHAMNNVCSFLLPNYDSSIAPFSVFIVTAIVVVIVTFLWGSRTLAQFMRS